MFGKQTRDEDGVVISRREPGSDHILEILAQDYLREKKTRRRWGLFFRFLIVAYIATTTWLYFHTSDLTVDDDHVAVVVIDGLIGPGEISAPEVNHSLKDAFEAEASKAVIVKINSPGGTPVQAAQINAEISRLQELHPEKPVYAAISDICASGGYYVAVAASEIYAHPSSIVGSIGVLMNGFGFTGTMEKLGIERRLITAGENKGLLDPFSPERPGDRRHAQAMLDDVHGDFIDAVKQGRGERLSNDPDIFSGLFWSGRKALELGLVDAFGSEKDIARDVIGVEKLVDYTYRPGILREFAERIGVSLGSSFYNNLFRLQ